mmetsp:Transcript_8398/g.12941  ORF Transcript_8398/g.12941 Transcript_8398/m.12941 type:complete len:171 (-) Transcript_8398:135-647(-)|eukprot:CAMPEP_0178915160 /NCGR_PEP_ID=MMETSP0786-20121207/11860_1 /TAXON_ID=186022 /ORGANISM="Thalassionema frauenfeldii, Strain CCMP 1798" /LENGTH=170 /DNA_ID=CAMNT_0020588215 /DNA_START=115 /DNA_END=627 /DNA_ORIENTATION=+
MKRFAYKNSEEEDIYKSQIREKQGGENEVDSLLGMKKFENSRPVSSMKETIVKHENSQSPKCKIMKPAHSLDATTLGTKDTTFLEDSASTSLDEDKERQPKNGRVSKSQALRKYGKRSSRGALVPKRRFDVEMKTDGVKALMQRGSKRRKSKKKQSHDAAVVEFAMKNLS